MSFFARSVEPAASVLFVCLGNICRSPTAEGVFRAAAERAGLRQARPGDSAGLGDWHVGSPPDRRAIQAARRRGYDLTRDARTAGRGRRFRALRLDPRDGREQPARADRHEAAGIRRAPRPVARFCAGQSACARFPIRTMAVPKASTACSISSSREPRGCSRGSSGSRRSLPTAEAPAAARRS